MAGESWADADVELVRFAIGDARYDEGSVEQARAVLDALTAPSSPLVARIRAQAGQDAARAVEAAFRDEPGVLAEQPARHVAHGWSIRAARLVREVTGATGEEGDRDA